MSDPTPAAAADQDVLITRIFDAPRAQVFKAWTDPDGHDIAVGQPIEQASPERN